MSFFNWFKKNKISDTVSSLILFDNRLEKIEIALGIIKDSVDLVNDKFHKQTPYTIEAIDNLSTQLNTTAIELKLYQLKMEDFKNVK